MEVYGAEDQDDPVSLYVGITIFFLNEMKEIIHGHNKQRTEGGSKVKFLSMVWTSKSIEDISPCARARHGGEHFPGTVSILVLLSPVTQGIHLVSKYMRTCSRNSSIQYKSQPLTQP